MWKKKPIIIFVFFVVLFAASFMVEGETRSSIDDNEYESVFSGEKEISAHFFYGQGCPHCDRVKPFIVQMENEHSLTVYKYEIYHNRNNIVLLSQYFDMHAVPTARRGVPALFVSDSCLVGDEPILSRFEEVISEMVKEDSSVDHTSDIEVKTPEDLVQESACGESAGKSGCPSIVTLTIAALIDSVSPCSLAVLLFLVGVRPLVTDRRRRALKVGLAFSFSVFLTYTLFGLGLLGVIGITGLSSAFGLVAGLIGIFAGILYVKDCFWRGYGGFVMEVPRSLRPLVNRMIKSVTSPLGAFLVGFAICCFELPCTGGPYLFILGQLANTATRLQAIPMLLYYNFLFVVPLLLISLFLYFGFFSLQKAREWNDSNKGLLRLVSGLTIIALGFLVIPGWELSGLIRMFLGCCRVVLPPVLLTLSFYLVFSFLRLHQMGAKRFAETTLLVALPVLSVLAYLQLFENVEVNVAANVGDGDVEFAVSEFPSALAGVTQSRDAFSETIRDSDDVVYERPDDFAGTRGDSMLVPEKTTGPTAEARAEVEERAKLYDDETEDEVIEQESEDETVSSACDEESPGMANPASVYCIELGYEYRAVDTDEGEYGTCIFPDGSECEEWKFFTGKCGQEYSYCARQGYDVLIKSDGKDPFSKEYAVCVQKGEEIGAVTDLFSLSGKATVGIVRTNASENIKTNDELSSNLQAPSLFDWRNHNGENWMTPVKNQNPCGSCWAFSAVGVTEAIYNIYTGNPDLDLDLSEQFLVSDCSDAGTCCGGWKVRALEYIRDTGTSDEACFPYVDNGCSCPGDPPICSAICTHRTGGECSDATCGDRCANWHRRLTKIDLVDKVSSDQATIKQTIVDKGPLSVSMGTGADFGGAFDGNNIYRCTDDTGANHAVIIVGYNDTGGYWIVKNSWGRWWGPHGNGYFRVGYGECAIESSVYYAEPDRKECGETITSDTVLVDFLFNCPGNGLIIGTSNITLDCQGESLGGVGSGVGIDNEHNYVTIKNCAVYGFARGIYLHHVADYNTLLNNDVSYNELEGIYLDDAWSNNITGNEVTYNGLSGLHLLDRAKYNDIIDNKFYRNGGHGILLYGTSHSNDIIGNYLQLNGECGMLVWTDNNQIIENTAKTNIRFGLELFSTSGNILEGNVMWDNLMSGVIITLSTYTTIEGTWLLENGGHGVGLYNSNYTTIRDSNFWENTLNGINIGGSHHNTIQTSSFLGTYGAAEGIKLSYSNDNKIRNNVIAHSGEEGLHIRYSNYNVINFNRIKSNRNYGIYLYQADHNNILNNLLQENDDPDGMQVYILDSNDNDFSNNILDRAKYGGKYGIFHTNSWDTNFHNNTVCGYFLNFYILSGTYTANENTCGPTYGFNDHGQPTGCDFRCAHANLVVRGMNNRIYYNAWGSASGWRSWVSLPGATPDAPAAAILGDELHMVVRGMTGGLYHGYVDLSTGGFSGWSRISGDTPSPPALAVSLGTGQTLSKLYLVVRGMDDRIYYKVWDGTSWGGWNVLPGATSEGPAAAVYDWYDEKLYLVVRGMDERSLWFGWIRLSDDSFHGWTRLSGATPSAPTLVSNGDELVLVVRGLDNGIYFRFFHSVSDTWGDWNWHSGATGDRPAAAVNGDYLYLVVRGMTGGLYHRKYYIPTDDYYRWTRISGDTPSAPTLTLIYTPFRYN